MSSRYLEGDDFELTIVDLVIVASGWHIAPPTHKNLKMRKINSHLSFEENTEELSESGFTKTSFRRSET